MVGKKATKGDASAPVKPAGPAVKALTRAWDPETAMDLTASLRLTDGGRVDLELATWGQGNGSTIWKTYDAGGKNNGGAHESLTFWSSKGPQQPQLADAFMRVVAPWSSGTLQPETVTATCKKSAIGGKALRELAVAAFCEACGVARPDTAALRRLGRSKGSAKSAVKDQLIKELATGKSGVQAWNRKGTSSWAALGTDRDFGARTLDGAALDGVDLDRVSLARSSLKKASLRESRLSGSNLAGVSAAGADFSDSEGYRTNFTKADLPGARFQKANLRHARFQNANLVGADFRDAELEHADFRGANLTDARLGADLTFADLTDAIVAGADFTRADLIAATLHGADLSGADLRRAKLAIVGDDYKIGTRWDKYKGARYDGRTQFPKGYTPPATLLLVRGGKSPARKPGPGAKQQRPGFVDAMKDHTDAGRLKSALSMLKADRFQLFVDVSDEHVVGVVKSQSDDSLVYACKLTDAGAFCCCTQNLNPCGGLRGALCKHLLVLTIGLVVKEQLPRAAADEWVRQSRAKAPSLDKTAMADVFLKFKGAEAGTIDWRPTETIPEDFYAL